MQADTFAQRRIIMLARPRLGAISPSRRVRRALEAQGHAVFWFTPQMWPQLFDGPRARVERLRALIERWDVDALVMADGVGTTAEGATGLRRIVFAASDGELGQSLAACEGAEPDALWLIEGVSGDARARSAWGIGQVTDLSDLTLANDIVSEEALVCVRDASAGREEALRAAAGGGTVRCLGEGWPEGLLVGSGESDAAYALRGARTLAALDDAPGSPLERYLAACHRQLSAAGEKGVGAPEGASFEESIVAALEGSVPPSPTAPSAPARAVSVLGYVGWGNFGDEYILSTIAERLGERLPGTLTVAVGENPWHTLVNRGIYTVPLADKMALDALLERSSAALVMAGLLFDQGIRWTMGKAEMVSSVLHTDIPGIAAYVALARSNDTPVVLYGIGAGPLESGHARRLVRLMGALGARFSCRDAETAELIAGCGVPAELVARRADVAFTGSARRTALVDGWLAREGLDAEADELIVVSLRDYENVADDLPARVAGALSRALAARPRAHAVLCLLDAADRGISERVAASMADSGRVHLFDPGDDIDAVADLLGRATAGLSMRYHCSLLLLRGGSPCVGLGYLPKVCSLYQEAGMGDFLLGMDATEDELARALLRALEERGELREQIAGGVASLAERARRTEDELVETMAPRTVAGSQGRAHELFLYSEAASDRMLRDERRRADGAEAQLAEARRELDEARRRIAELEGSNSHRVGSLLMKVPGKLKHAIRR